MGSSRLYLSGLIFDDTGSGGLASYSDALDKIKHTELPWWLVPVIERRLRIAILIYLWGALVEDTSLFVMAWLFPDAWFRFFHGVAPAGLDIAFLRRSAGQWAAFALAQGITLWRWRQNPVWLVIVAGVRFSDLFTDISYILAVPSLTTLGWVCLLPPPLLNLVGVIIMLRGYKDARSR